MSAHGPHHQRWHGLQSPSFRYYDGSMRHRVRETPALTVKCDQPRSSRRRKEHPILGHHVLTGDPIRAK